MAAGWAATASEDPHTIYRFGQLATRDRGRFMEGRLLEPARLVLPYWDEPVVPYGGLSPVLRGNPSAEAEPGLP